jgi:DNA-binding LacI/PurR family transcriptional regulator
MARKLKQRSTMKEVAERAGVAKTTVSHAISGKRPVAPDTREKIFAAMRDLHFTPNPIARRLAGSASHAIALVFPLASQSLAAVELRYLNSIGEVVNRGDYTFLTLTSPRVRVDDLRQVIYSGMVDGVILMRIHVDDERVELLKEAGLPFVMVGRTRHNDGLIYVDLDVENAIDLAVSHLVDLGHAHIAFICPDDLAFGFAYRLMKGYEKSCRKHHLAQITIPAGWSDDAGYRAMRALMSEHPELTGVISWSDVVAVGAISALHASGRAIPRDMSLISFDRSEHLPMASSDLTIVDTRPEAIGTQAARMLLNILNEESPQPDQVLVPSRLVQGRSTARPARVPRRSIGAQRAKHLKVNGRKEVTASNR